MSNLRVIGIEESNSERCECCGTKCPKRRIVLTDGINDFRYGTQCAAMTLLGAKSKLNADKIIRKAKALSYIDRKIKKFGTDESVLKSIAQNVTSYYVPCWIESGKIVVA